MLRSFVLLVACASALTLGVADARDRNVRAAFQRSHPCPANGATRGACPGWEVDHVVPLCARGPDTVANMQWQTVKDAQAKDQVEFAQCRALRRAPHAHTAAKADRQ